MKTNLNNFIKTNSPTILTVIGSIGVCVTAVMAARDTVKALKRIEEEQAIAKKRKIEIAAPCYIPTVISGVVTILCVFGSNKLNKNMQKSITSAYILLDQSYKEYRKSVNEVYGEEGSDAVIQHMADKRAAEIDMSEESDQDTFFDFFSLQFFKSTTDTIENAEKEINHLLRENGYVSLRTLYTLMGEPVIGTDDLLGWSIAAGRLYDYEYIDVEMRPMVREDGSKYYIIDFPVEPTEDYLYL